MTEKVTSRFSWLLWKPYDAITIAPYIIVRPAWAYNMALLEHERVHLRRQREVGRIRWWWKYLTDSDFRLAEEVMAYRRQLEVGTGPLTKERAAEYLQSYKPGLTYVEALRLL